MGQQTAMRQVADVTTGGELLMDESVFVEWSFLYQANGFWIFIYDHI